MSIPSLRDFKSRYAVYLSQSRISRYGNALASSVRQIIKGSKKDPLHCLGFCVPIFLLAALVLGSPSLLDALYEENTAALASAVITPLSPPQGPFIEPKKNLTGDSPELSFIQANSLSHVASPVIFKTQVLGAFGEMSNGEQGNKKSIIEYTVGEGDTIAQIAQKFNISTNTILWANNLNKYNRLKAGQQLVILPVSGVLYTVKSGDTLSEIAKNYKGNVTDIVAMNDLNSEADIFIGDILIIPDGVMPPRPTLKQFAEIPIGSSYFIPPHTPVLITQGLHWYNAVDFGGTCGDPIYAAAKGVVIRVKYGWNAGGGNYIKILHSNGTITYYGHIEANLVNVGQEVSQGQIIALMGGGAGMAGAGLSTGCHVHFGVQGARNPFAP